MQLPPKPQPKQNSGFVPAGDLKSQFETLGKGAASEIAKAPIDILEAIPEQLAGAPTPEQNNPQQTDILAKKQEKEVKARRRFQALQAEIRDINANNQREEMQRRQIIAQQEQARKAQAQEQQESIIIDTGSKIKRGVLGAAGAAKKHLQNKQQHMERPKQSST